MKPERPENLLLKLIVAMLNILSDSDHMILNDQDWKIAYNLCCFVTLASCRCCLDIIGLSILRDFNVFTSRM